MSNAPEDKRKRDELPAAGMIPLWPGFVVTALCGLIYLSVGSGGTFRFPPSTYIHHQLTANAWLHGRLHVTGDEIERHFFVSQLRNADGTLPEGINYYTPPAVHRRAIVESFRRQGIDDQQIRGWLASYLVTAYHDWIRFGDRYYAYWPPTTTLITLPFVLLFGPGASDILIGNLLGMATAFAVYLMLRSLKPHWPGLTTMACVGLTLFYCVGTCHLYQACVGQTWQLAQLSGTLFLIISIWLGFKAIRRPSWLVVAGTMLGLGFLARNTIIMAAPFFAVVLWLGVRGSKKWLKRYVGWGSAFVLMLLLAVTVQLGFNQARFGKPLDFGQAHQVTTGGNPRFKADFEEYGRFSSHYVKRNLYYYFVNVATRTDHPKVPGRTFDPMGNGLFVVSPPMIYLLLCWRQRRRGLLVRSSGEPPLSILGSAFHT